MTFAHAGEYLADLEPEDVACLLSVSADVALVVDQGIVRDVSVSVRDLSGEDFPRRWLDKPWIECVTEESRPKIEELLDRAGSARALEVIDAQPWRQVNHPSLTGLDVPVSYAAISVPGSNRVFAVGREQRAISLLQQRLMDAHQTVERDYARLRAAEARYTSLFRSIPTPVMIVEPSSGVVTDANPAAARYLSVGAESLLRRPIGQCFHDSCEDALQKLVSELAREGVSTSMEVRTRADEPCTLSASLFRDVESDRIVVSLQPVRALAAGEDAGTRPVSTIYSNRSQLVSILQGLPDGLVVIGPDLRILAANAAFRDLVGLRNRESEVGLWLPDHLGRSTTELNVLVSNLRSQGSVRNFLTVIRDVLGREEEAEVSAVAAEFTEGGARRGAPAYGLAIRSIARRFRGEPSLGEALPRSVEQLTGLVGRMPLKQIVQETTDFIERLCIEAALEVTRDNRASAAEMLGLSRQALYAKLKRFGFDR